MIHAEIIREKLLNKTKPWADIESEHVLWTTADP